MDILEQLEEYIVPSMSNTELNVVAEAKQMLEAKLKSLPSNAVEMDKFIQFGKETKELEAKVREFLVTGHSTMDAVNKFNTTYKLVNRVSREMRESAAMSTKQVGVAPV